MGKGKKKTVLVPKKKIRKRGDGIPPIGWKYDLRAGASRNPDGTPVLVKMEMTGPGLAVEDPLVILESESESETESVNPAPHVLTRPRAMATRTIRTSVPRQQHLDRQLQILRGPPSSIVQHTRRPGSSSSTIPLGHLYVSGTPPWGLPPNVVDRTPPNDSAHKCTICAQIFSHPVSVACDNQQGHGHIFCYGCIRQAVATSMNCPICRTRIHAKPARMPPYEAALASLFPDQLDQSQVVWANAWDGIEFDV
ncbi:hypothetical protein C8R44DRAFT_744992 [Mycena epipterygia]|nr:hypothetical protein C8R44DRAFT_744992 [Mycena epipterygia]